MISNTLRLPNDSERLTILGMSGSGKTVAGMWHLSQRSYDIMPWFVFDFKDEEFIDQVKWAKHLDLKDKPPKKPGLYIVHPDVENPAACGAYLRKIWENENSGVYIDEGYMLERSKDFERICITGRSRKVPLITLSQRPAWISRFAFSEANYHQVFTLSDTEDYKRVKQFLPYDFDKNPLGEYQSVWYDVKLRRAVIFAPVPNQEEILGTFEERLTPRKIYI